MSEGIRCAATREIQRGFLIGHRGAAAHAPENTLASMRKAAQLGLRWVEFDVRLCRDGNPVVFHDDRLSRTTNSRGRVAERDLADLKRLDAGAWFGRDFVGERIPTLREAVMALADLGIGANVEIKADRGREADSARVVMETLLSSWPSHLPAPVISSFSSRVVAAAAAAAPVYQHAWLVDVVPRDWRRHLQEIRGTALHCKAQKLKRERALEIVEAEVPLRCYTVNTSRLARRLFDWGVEAVITDDPLPLA